MTDRDTVVVTDGNGSSTNIILGVIAIIVIFSVLQYQLLRTRGGDK